MVFLEAWLAGRPLVGRDLPEVTTDFVKAGLRLNRLSPRLVVPAEWIDVHRFRQTVLDAHRFTLATYGRPQPLDLSDALDAKTANGLIDFADLDEPLQRQVLETAQRSDGDRRRILQCNPHLRDAFECNGSSSGDVISQNVEVIERHYSLAASGKRLQETYRHVGQSVRFTAPQPLSKAAHISDRFLGLQRFRLIRA